MKKDIAYYKPSMFGQTTNIWLCFLIFAEIVFPDLSFKLLLMIEAAGLILCAIWCIGEISVFRRTTIGVTILFILYVGVYQILNFKDIHYGLLLRFLSAWIILLLYLLRRRCLFPGSLLYSVIMATTLMSLLVFIFEKEFTDRTQIQIWIDTYTGANALSFAICIGALALVFLLFHGAHKSLNIFYLGSLIIHGYVIFRMQSRGALVALMAGILMLLIGNIFLDSKSRSISKILILFIGAASVCVLLIVSYKRGSGLFDDNGRLELWKTALRYWNQNILFGKNIYLIYDTLPSSHNLFFDILSQLGLIGLAGILIIFGYYLRGVRHVISYAFVVFALVQSLIDANSAEYIIIALILAGAVEDIIKQKKGVRKFVFRNNSSI